MEIKTNIFKKSSRMAKKERIPEDLTENLAPWRIKFSSLAVFKSAAHLSVYNTDNEELKTFYGRGEHQRWPM